MEATFTLPKYESMFTPLSELPIGATFIGKYTKPKNKGKIFLNKSEIYSCCGNTYNSMSTVLESDQIGCLATNVESSEIFSYKKQELVKRVFIRKFYEERPDLFSRIRVGDTVALRPKGSICPKLGDVYYVKSIFGETSELMPLFQYWDNSILMNPIIGDIIYASNNHFDLHCFLTGPTYDMILEYENSKIAEKEESISEPVVTDRLVRLHDKIQDLQSQFVDMKAAHAVSIASLTKNLTDNLLGIRDTAQQNNKSQISVNSDLTSRLSDIEKQITSLYVADNAQNTRLDKTNIRTEDLAAHIRISEATNNTNDGLKDYIDSNIKALTNALQATHLYMYDLKKCHKNRLSELDSSIKHHDDTISYLNHRTTELNNKTTQNEELLTEVDDCVGVIEYTDKNDSLAVRVKKLEEQLANRLENPKIPEALAAFAGGNYFVPPINTTSYRCSDKDCWCNKEGRSVILPLPVDLVQPVKRSFWRRIIGELIGF